MNRIAVKMDTETTVVTGVDALERHLDDLLQDPDLPLTAKLFDDVELQLTEANTPPLIPLLLPKLTEVLKTYRRQDPAVLCSLAIKLLRPLSLTQILTLASEDAIVQALRSPAPSANLLAMAVVEKAARSPADAAILAMMKNVVASFVAQWLGAPQVEVGEKGSRILGDLLDVDCDARVPQNGEVSSSTAINGTEIAVRRKPPGQGLMWRRIFHDRDIYSLILSLCSSKSSGSDSDSPQQQQQQQQQQRTLAQGRLLRILPRLAALNLAAVSRTDFADLNQRYATDINIEGSSDSDTGFGLLRFAALHMIDRADELMHLNLIDFFEALLSIQRIATPYSAYKMETLRTLVRGATARDEKLRAAISSLPERTVPEEADELRKFVHDVTSS